MPHPLDDPEVVVASVRILRSISHKPFVSQASREVVVVGRVDLGIPYLCRPAFQTMLTNHNRATFARLHVFREEEYPVRKHIRPYIQHYLIPLKLGLIQNQPGPRVSGQSWRWQTTDHFVPEIVAIELSSIFPSLEGRSVGLFPELLSPIR